MNVVNLIGRITHDLALQSNERTTWLNFQIAVASQDPKKDDQFFSCVAFGKTAEFMNNWSGKGALIALEGRLEASEYEYQDRTKVKHYKIIVNRVEPLEWKKKKAETTTDIPKGETPETGNALFDEITDEDIPF